MSQSDAHFTLRSFETRQAQIVVAQTIFTSVFFYFVFVKDSE